MNEPEAGLRHIFEGQDAFRMSEGHRNGDIRRLIVVEDV